MRQKVERFFCRIKEFRRIATRYDKLAKTFMAFVHLVCAFVGFEKSWNFFLAKSDFLVYILFLWPAVGSVSRWVVDNDYTHYD